MILDEAIKSYIDELCETDKNFSEAKDLSFVIPSKHGKIMEHLDSCTYKDKNIHFFESTWVKGTGMVICKKAEEQDLLNGDD